MDDACPFVEFPHLCCHSQIPKLVKMIRFFLSIVAFLLPVHGAFAATVTVLALGDSLTAGLGLPADQAFPARLEAALKAKGFDVSVLNGGVSGDTAEDGLARLDWALTPGVSAVIVELGANDALRGLPPGGTEAALDQILSKLDGRKLPVLIAGMRSPPNLGPQYAASFDPSFARLAAKHSILLYPFFLDGVAADQTLNQQDGMHPTAQGVDRIVARMLPMVEQLIGKVAQK
jgi:acyl-CoA thioesterase-1